MPAAKPQRRRRPQTWPHPRRPRRRPVPDPQSDHLRPPDSRQRLRRTQLRSHRDPPVGVPGAIRADGARNKQQPRQPTPRRIPEAPPGVEPVTRNRVNVAVRTRAGKLLTAAGSFNGPVWSGPPAVPSPVGSSAMPSPPDLVVHWVAREPRTPLAHGSNRLWVSVPHPQAGGQSGGSRGAVGWGAIRQGRP